MFHNGANFHFCLYIKVATTECINKILLFFDTYKLHKATSGMITILSKYKRKTLDGATSELCGRTVRHRTLCETLSRRAYTCGVKMSLL